MSRRLLLGGAVLPSAKAEMRIDQGVLVDEGIILDVASADRLRREHPDVPTVDATDLLLLPGLTNAHMHAYGLLAHGIPLHHAPTGFYEFLKDFWWPYVEDRLDRPMIEAAMRLACCLMIRSGVTSFCDVLEAPNAPPGILDVEAHIVEEAGLRGVLMTEACERIDASLGRRLLDENAQFAAERKEDARIRGMLCLHTSFTCSRGFVEHARDMQRDLECGLHLHLSESRYEPDVCVDRNGLRPVIWYDELGLWNPSVLASQVVAVDAEEIRTLAERGVKTAHMPLSNCEVGGGIAPVPEMLRAGLRPGLGTDGYINDMFEVMRGAFLIHKAAQLNPSAMPARAVLSMATRSGAEAIGFDRCGEIVPGARADIIGIDACFDTPLQTENVLDQLLLYRGERHVRLSMVDGEILMQEGEIRTIDEAAARTALHAQATRLWEGLRG